MKMIYHMRESEVEMYIRASECAARSVTARRAARRETPWKQTMMETN